jgi:hypothetical protein
MKIYKNKTFSKWQKGTDLTDQILLDAAIELSEGLYDGDYGSCTYKKRIGRPGHGKREGFRTIIATKFQEMYIFIYGFGKSEADDLTSTQKKELRMVSKALLDLSNKDITNLESMGLLIKIGEHNGKRDGS